jgi:hypothetical protein
MRPSQLTTLPEFFDRYIRLMDDIPLLTALEHYAIVFHGERDNLTALGDTVYAPGKWSAKQILRHCIDTERILAYRALRFARQDATPLAGFDEESYARHADVSQSSIASLLDEWQIQRHSTIALFRGFTPAMLLCEGIASERTISVAALGFAIVGHPLHHIRVLQERYYSMW